ncbi:MAG: TIR domain-containing protein [Pseudomonadales bacterium]
MQTLLPAYDGDGPFLFVSYAHVDADIVMPEMHWLQDRGFAIWYDEGIRVGTIWRQALADAITGSRGLIFFATKQSVVSRNCVREVNFALDEGKPVFVVQLDDTKLPDALRLSLSDRQALIRSNFDEASYRERLASALREGTDFKASTDARGIRPGRSWRNRVVAVVLAVLAVVGTAIMFTSRSIPSLSNPVQITSAIGVEEYPSWSPSGQTLAYQSNEGGDWDVWVRQPGSSEAINRTALHSGHDMFPSWSPDERSIAFWSDRDGGGYFVMPWLTGDAVKVVALKLDALGNLRYRPVGPPRWSRDGKRLLYVVGTVTAGTYGEVVSLDTGETTQFDMPGRVPGFDPAWSDDESRIAYVAGWHREYETSSIRVKDLAGATSKAITTDELHHLGPSWIDNDQVIYVANRGSSRDLWLQGIASDLAADGAPVRLTTGVGMRQAALSADRTKLAYSKGRRISNVWRVPILEQRLATWADAEQITFDQAWVEFVDISPDGENLVISSDRAGNKDLWLLPAEPGTSNVVQLTTTSAPEWAPAWSPDGQEIAFYAYRNDTRSLFTMPSNGGPSKPIETGALHEAFIPAWSPDGSRVAFRATNASANNDIYVLERETGTITRMTTDPGMDIFASWAADGSLTFTSTRNEESRIWRIAAGESTPKPFSQSGMSYHDWAPDGRHLYAIGVQAREGNIWELSIDGEERAVTDLAGKRRGNLGTEAMATDGKYVYFTWEDDLGDIWIMDVSWSWGS